MAIAQGQDNRLTTTSASIDLFDGRGSCACSGRSCMGLLTPLSLPQSVRVSPWGVLKLLRPSGTTRSIVELRRQF